MCSLIVRVLGRSGTCRKPAYFRRGTVRAAAAQQSVEALPVAHGLAAHLGAVDSRFALISACAEAFSNPDPGNAIFCVRRKSLALSTRSTLRVRVG